MKRYLCCLFCACDVRLIRAQKFQNFKKDFFSLSCVYIGTSSKSGMCSSLKSGRGMHDAIMYNNAQKNFLNSISNLLLPRWKRFMMA
jgi:hypothetical protein